jgi:hypothetical protein
MEMEREIISLSDYELGAVVGGRMHNGQINELVLKNPDNGVPGSFASSNLAKIIEIAAAAVVVTTAALFAGGGTGKN